MKAKLYLSLGAFFLLTGCGTVKINIDYGNTPIPGSTDTPGLPTPTPMPSATPTSTITPTATETLSPSPTESLSGIIAVAAGHSHTCAVTEGGIVKCWGANDHGQLGNGSMIDSDIPVDVNGLAGVKAITAGWGHTCALTSAGGVKCWGYNFNGELGNGTMADSDVPVDVAGLSAGASAIDAGDDHTCAVIAGNRLKCWGYNGYGQLGDDTTSSRSVPIESPYFGGGVADVAAGWGHTCVQTTDGWAKCWGNNEYGQLGIGKATDIHLPATDVVNLNGKVLKVAADGGQTCALTAGGGVQCWGNDKYGQLGDGTNQKENTPVQVAGLTSGVSNVEVGWNHACAVVSGGVLECWGWNYYGELGDGTKITQPKPVKVSRLTDGVRDIAVGWGHTCVATELGAVKCWGLNASGQLGDGTQNDSGAPLTVVRLASSAGLPPTVAPTVTPAEKATDIPTATLLPTGTASSSIILEGALAISVGLGDTCAVTISHGLKCWGLNTSGQLGNGSVTDSNRPIPVSGLSTGVKAVVVGDLHICAIVTGDDVQCWGSNEFGQLGTISPSGDQSTPVHALMAEGWGVLRGLVLGREHTCVLNDAGEVRCWGSDRYGQLGDGENPLFYGDVAGVGQYDQAISARGFSTCALLIGGVVSCWGGNTDGQLGDGTKLNRDSPSAISELTSPATAVSMGYDHACALMHSGGVKCWGSNQTGQLGNGTTMDSLTPVDVVGLTGDVAEIQSGRFFTCARMRDGRVMCWGAVIGLLDHGQSCSPNGICAKPVEIDALKEPAVSFAVGDSHVCVLTGTGKIFCWGDNTYGQLGDGSNRYRETPVEVIGF